MKGGCRPIISHMAEQVLGGPIPDVVTLQRRPPSTEGPPEAGGVAVSDAPPQARFVTSAEPDLYASKANRLVIKHQLGQVVAVIEIVSPGNKNRPASTAIFCCESRGASSPGCSSPGRRFVSSFAARPPRESTKPSGTRFSRNPSNFPPTSRSRLPPTVPACPHTAYVEPVAVGDPLPSLPIFLDPGTYVPAPLEETYQSTWDKCPEPLKELVQNPNP